jgi:hypothetical protein
MDSGEGRSLFSQLTPVFRSAQSSEKRKLRQAERAASRNLLLGEGSAEGLSSQDDPSPVVTRRVAGRKRLRVACDSSDEEGQESFSELVGSASLAERERAGLLQRDDSSDSEAESDDGSGGEDPDDDVTYMGTTRVPRGPPPVWAQTFLTRWLVPVVREYEVASSPPSS